MKLKKILKDVNYEVIKGNLDIEINDIAYNSNNVKKDFMFVALKGFRVDGHNYIKNAIEKGASCIVLEDDVLIKEDITVIKLKNARENLSRLSRAFFNYPDKEMTTIAITGTKGKTTTSTIIKKILDDNGKSAGLIGTMGVFYLDKFYHTMNTSPESYDVFKYMREMLDNNVNYLVMEISSQSLKLKRWEGVIFDYAIFTNLSLDHVGKDEHDDFEDYKNCKKLLFEKCKVGIYNSDDKYYEEMKGKCENYTFGKNSSDFKLESVSNIFDGGFSGIEMKVSGKINDTFRVSIPGFFTAYNVLAALSVCCLMGIDNVKSSLKSVSVKGRMESVNVSSKFSVLIDYAYQGIAMENVLLTVKEGNSKRIVTVFGCGGNRSKQRRYDTGEVSGKYADVSILTSDNPRYENKREIIDDILIGMKKTNGKYIIIEDRKEAIKYSLLNAKEGDVILILGKGHEDYQEIEGVRYPFDERVIISEIINEFSPSTKEKLGIIKKE